VPLEKQQGEEFGEFASGRKDPCLSNFVGDGKNMLDVIFVRYFLLP
jgi:hypothetical protein